jgi:lipoprotein-anchoring transpeptidase ErfK/SrfK
VPGVTDSTAVVDKATYDRLVAAAGTTPLVADYTVTADDVDGPFVKVPDKVYDQAKLQCLCYSSATEALAEKFHTSERMLRQLNPKVKLDSIAAGTVLSVPNVAQQTSATPVTKLVISRSSFWIHGLDATGKIVWYAPSTLGAGYDPSPTGDYRVTNIAQDPTFHYQPTLFAEVPDSRPEANLPAGPNSPVGVVWMALSKPHYGIHGTSSPETIGYANSHGCVRLTNWDARELSSSVKAGTPVEFVN